MYRNRLLFASSILFVSSVILLLSGRNSAQIAPINSVGSGSIKVHTKNGDLTHNGGWRFYQEKVERVIYLYDEVNHVKRIPAAESVEIHTENWPTYQLLQED